MPLWGEQNWNNSGEKIKVSQFYVAIQNFVLEISLKSNQKTL